VEIQEERAQPRRFLLPAILAVLAIAAIGAAVAFAGSRNAPAAPATATLTASSTVMDTATATVTGIAIPVQVIDQAGVTMRLVSAGDFIMGSDRGMPDEKPQGTFYLDEFYIDKYEVTNAFYAACVKAGVCDAPRPGKTSARVAYFGDSNFDNYPVVNVDWNMARAYCEWRGARLPTELEWEKAARGPDGRTYPWGEEISCNQANYFGCEGEMDSVSRFENGISVYGVQNMAGNVAEWVSSLYKAYPYDMTDGREDLQALGERVLRGGAWINSDSDNEVRASHRQQADPATASDSIGFRCARTPDYLIADTGTVLNPQNAFTSTAIAVQKRSTKVRDSEAFNPSVPVFAGASTSIPSSTAPANPTSASIAPSQISAEPPTGEPTRMAPTDTDVPPTEVPPTLVPPTDVPPTDVPPTDVPPTDIPPTDVPPTDPPPTDVPTDPPVVDNPA
jgi:formylglycine-generating enzyme required for sulfatase activity